jgi:hypothetical protein
MLGQKVYSSSMRTSTLTIPITWNRKGVYIVNIYDEPNNVIKTEKIILE